MAALQYDTLAQHYLDTIVHTTCTTLELRILMSFINVFQSQIEPFIDIWNWLYSQVVFFPVFPTLGVQNLFFPGRYLPVNTAVKTGYCPKPSNPVSNARHIYNYTVAQMSAGRYFIFLEFTIKKILSNAQHVYNYSIAQMFVGRYLSFWDYTIKKNIVQCTRCIFIFLGLYNKKKTLSNAEHVYNYTIAQMSIGRSFTFLG